MSALFSYGARVLSHLKTASASVGTPTDDGPIAYLTNAVLAQNVSFEEATAAAAVDLGSSLAPDFGAVFNHNLDGTVRLQGSDAANFSALIVNVLMVPAQPNFWYDLRSTTPRTARYWRASVTSNGDPVEIGKFVVGTVESTRAHLWDYQRRVGYLEYTQGPTETGVFVRDRQGVAVRGRTATWRGPRAVEALLRAISEAAGESTAPVIFVPNDEEADVWFLDWSDAYSARLLAANWAEVSSVMAEQSPGTRQ